MNLLSVQNINKSFGERPVLKNVSFSLEKGEFVSIIGKSGSGKSTLFNIIAGLEAPDLGQVILNGNEITGKTGHVSYMLQKDLLFPYYTILDNVCLPLVIGGSKKEEVRARVAPLFKDFGIEGTQKLYPTQLSGGMKQRAALLRTYLSAREITLLDEPFSALDMLTKTQMHDWYLSTVETLHLTTLLITHDIEEALQLSDRILVLENLTDSPASSSTNLIKEIIVNQPRTQRKDFPFTPEFLHLKQELKRAVLPEG